MADVPAVVDPAEWARRRNESIARAEKLREDRRRAAAAAAEEAAIRDMEHAEGVRRGFAVVVVPGEGARAAAAGGRRARAAAPAVAGDDGSGDGGEGGGGESAAGGGAPGGGGGAKKSAAVAEIERIAAARDARRLRHAAAAAAREAAIAEHGDGDDVAVRRMIKNFRAAAGGGGGGGEGGASPAPPDPTRRLLVCVRKRPMNARERADYDVVTVAPGGTKLIVHEPRAKVDMTRFLENHVFHFDRVFGEAAASEDLYNGTLAPIMKGVFRGGRVTCFAYGQTGSGKTHTMDQISVQAVEHLFRIASNSEEAISVTVSFFEIYMSRAYDLFAGREPLEIMEDGAGNVQVVGLTECPCDTAADVLEMLRRGHRARSTASTQVNADSSRSHAIMTMRVRGGGGELRGTCTLVDLAGSERASETSSSDRVTRMEGAEINKSLLALKECIRAIDRGASHTPFRASKLTLVLRESFIGPNTRTIMITTISPPSAVCDHTLNSLRYADRLKEIGAREGGGGARGGGDDGGGGGSDAFARSGEVPPPPPARALRLARLASDPRGDIAAGVAAAGSAAGDESEENGADEARPVRARRGGGGGDGGMHTPMGGGGGGARGSRPPSSASSDDGGDAPVAPIGRVLQVGVHHRSVLSRSPVEAAGAAGDGSGCGGGDGGIPSRIGGGRPAGGAAAVAAVVMQEPAVAVAVVPGADEASPVGGGAMERVASHARMPPARIRVPSSPMKPLMLAHVAMLSSSKRNFETLQRLLVDAAAAEARGSGAGDGGPPGDALGVRLAYTDALAGALAGEIEELSALRCAALAMRERLAGRSAAGASPVVLQEPFAARGSAPGGGAPAGAVGDGRGGGGGGGGRSDVHPPMRGKGDGEEGYTFETGRPQSREAASQLQHPREGRARPHGDAGGGGKWGPPMGADALLGRR